MNKPQRRRQIVEEFQQRAGGCFSTIYRALNQAAQDNQDDPGNRPLKKQDVIAHIERIRRAPRAPA